MENSKSLLEAGKIVNTHGIRGEVKIQSWGNTPNFICSLKRIYIDGTSYSIRSAQVQKNCVIVSLDGVSNIDMAIRLKNKIVFAARTDIHLEEGEYFIQDLIGLSAINAENGMKLGQVSDILTLPAGNVYVIQGDREILVPAVPNFIKEICLSEGYIKISLIKGM